MHGYEIKQVFSTSFSELWHVSPGHLYPLMRYDFMPKLFFYRDKDPQKAAEEIEALQQTPL